MQDQNPQTDFKKSRRKKSAFSDIEPKLDRVPPHSPEAEQGVLGCILLSPVECLNECMSRFTAGAEVFYDLRHQVVYETLVEMLEARIAIDVITLQEHLKKKQRLEEVGGLVYLTALPDTVPSAANLNYYIEIVSEKHVLRKMISTCTEVVDKVYEHDGAVDKLLDEVERDILAINRATDSKADDSKTLVKKALGIIEDLHARQGAIGGISTGFVDLDKLSDGLHGSEMIVIAAKEKSGKTALAMNIAEHVVLEEKLPVGVFSFEMPSERLMLRLLCSRARVSLNNIRDRFLAERDFPKLTGSAGRLANAPLYIEQCIGWNLMRVKATARRMVQQHGLKVLVVDYLQKIQPTPGNKNRSREQEVAEISNGLAELANELNIAIIVLSQLNSDGTTRESRGIQFDCTALWKIVPVEPEDGEPVDNEVMQVNLLIELSRNGPTGKVPLTFLRSFARFESAAKLSDEEYTR